MEYIGEHLWVGNLGNFFVVLSFVMALLACISYFNAEKSGDSAWNKLGQFSFLIHSAAVLGMIFTMFFMIVNHYYEYHYVWKHSNNVMPMKYLLSSFWEGQEGSFLLWMFWHVVLGIILIFTSKSWESPVMTIFSSAQVFLSSMLLGVYVLDYKLGSNPFTELLREHAQYQNIPLFKNPDYLKMLDGQGLNPLLQNYWMTIHPPTLFLGFAATLIPFSFAIAGLWRRDFSGWLKQAIPWSFFGIMILGTGVLMGGAWAYEALSFGGFWAWDPVENASLVPWLILVGAAHLMLIYRNKGTTLKAMFFLTLLSFLLVLYSTFLTRSGVLGETSVHSFTDMGMSGQLLVYLLFYVFLSLFLMMISWKHFPKSDKEDETWSREFWMFIGALVLLISSFQITFSTSIPVINKIFGSDLAPPVNAIQHYNAWQIPFAILVVFMLGFTQFLKYKSTEFKIFVKNIAVAFIFSLVLAIVCAFLFTLTNPFHIALLFASLFGVFGNLDYLIKVLKGNFPKAGASIAHIGFSFVIMGALISTSKQQIISNNSSGIDITQLGEEFKNQENILLFKGDTMKMAEYKVVYQGKEKAGVNVNYQIDYFETGENGKPLLSFSLFPRVQLNPTMGNVPEPDTRHFLAKDIYTHVTFAELEDPNTDTSGFEEPKVKQMALGDSIFTSTCIIVLEGILKNFDRAAYHLEDDDLALVAKLVAYDMRGNKHELLPVFHIDDNSNIVALPEFNKKIGIKATFLQVDPETEMFEISIEEKKKNKREFIIMKAIVFPYINLLWLGCVLLFVGTLLAVVQRFKLLKNA